MIAFTVAKYTAEFQDAGSQYTAVIAAGVSRIKLAVEVDVPELLLRPFPKAVFFCDFSFPYLSLPFSLLSVTRADLDLLYIPVLLPPRSDVTVSGEQVEW